MECANHSERDAAVRCRACGRSLCLECAVEFDGAFSCQGECESATRTLLEAAHRSERATKRVAGGAIALLCLIGAFACFGIATKDLWTTQRANMDEDGNFHVDPPVTMRVTRAQKVGYTAGGVFLLVGGVYGLVTVWRLK
jgi:hypothetical protein